MRLPGATYFIRNNQFRGGEGEMGWRGGAVETGTLAGRSTSTLTDSNKCAGRRPEKHNAV